MTNVVHIKPNTNTQVCISSLILFNLGFYALAPADPILVFPNPASDYLDIPI